MRSMFRELRREPLEFPGVIWLPHIAKPIVEAVGTALPKFDSLGGKDVAAPVGGTRNFVGRIASFEFIPVLFEIFPTGDNSALRGGPCAKAAAFGPASEITF